MLNDKNAQSSPQRGKGNSPYLHAFKSRGQKKEVQGTESCIYFLNPFTKKIKGFLLIMKEGRRQDK